jgi:hypothetical protein
VSKSVPVRAVAPVLAATLIDWLWERGKENVPPNRLVLWRLEGGPPSIVDSPPPYQVASNASHALDGKV